ncbi:hypothetical protein Taro_010273, partial [Colocasia esculenta]|nr:hypothetical protein [Colocasia esculenta]
YSSDPNSPRSPPNEQEAADTVFAYWTRVRALEYSTELLAQSGPEEELNSFRFSFGSKEGTRSRARELGDHHVSVMLKEESLTQGCIDVQWGDKN